MPNPMIAMVGVSTAGGLAQASAQKKAAAQASNAQVAAAQLGVDEQRRQFDAVQRLLSPYVTAGNTAMQGQQALIGLLGPQRQQQAITALEGSPQMQAMVQQGEQGILSNASATGGLRGGNTQAALAQFRPAMLANMIESQYGKLGGLASMGQASASGQAAMGQQMGQNIAGLYQQQGAAQAGNALARGQATSNLWGNMAGGMGTVFGYGARNAFARDAQAVEAGAEPSNFGMFNRWGF